MTKVRLIIVFVSICLAQLAHAQIGGQSPYTTLNINGSARAAGLGGNPIALKDGDINTAALNPASLDTNLSGKLALSYVDYFAKTNMGYAAYAKTLRNKRITVAGTMQFVNYGKMDRIDAYGNVTGDFSAAEYALVLGAGYQMDSLWTIGGNFKTIYSNLAGYTSAGSAIDLAATYNKKPKRFTATFMIRNLGVQWKSYTSGTRESFPAEVQIGISKRPRHAPFRFHLIASNLQKWDLTYTNSNAAVVTDPVTGQVIETKAKFEFGDKLMRHMTIGTEVLLGENFAINIGYNYRRRQELKMPDRPATAGVSFGFGMKVKKFNLSYGRAIYNASGPSNHITISTQLGQWF